MCTLSIISLAAPGGFRVVMNRDEQRDRPAGLPPRWRALGPGDLPRRAVWPTDPLGGGTWIAAGEHGLVLCLLNLNEGASQSRKARRVSRGAIIPRLIGATRADEALARLRVIELTEFAPFRVVAVEPDQPGRHWGGGCTLHEARWDGREVTARRHGSGPRCFVSSGLGDVTVTPRLALFDELVGASTAAAQDAFHAHEWAERPEVSVRMSRADACTVSVTTVEVTPRPAGLPMVRMDYAATVSEEPTLSAAGASSGAYEPRA